MTGISDVRSEARIGVLTGSRAEGQRPRCQACSHGAPAAIVIHVPGRDYYACTACVLTLVAAVVGLTEAEASDITALPAEA